MAQPNNTGKLSAVALISANSRQYLSAVFAAHKAGKIVVAIPGGSKMRSIPGVELSERQTFEDDPGWFDETLPVIESDTPAQISFSSGTTGRPKALLLSHRALSNVVTRINAAMGLTDEVREYIGVPVTFSFGFGRARAVAVAGGKSYLPPNGFDPAEIGRMLKAGEINAISAVPTLWRVLLANPDVVRPAADKLRWIEIGSQFMSGDEKADLKQLFPNAKIVQHYGLTEASRSTLLDITASDGEMLESVGVPTGDVEIRINDDGLICVRGPHVATGRVTAAGVKPIVDADGWLTTSDKGRLVDGSLFYDGRTDELINSGGLKIDPTQFEQRLHAALGVSSNVAVGKQPDQLRGERVLIAYTSDAGVEGAVIEEKAAEVAAEFGLIGAGSLFFKKVAEIPLTATGKVKRAALTELTDTAEDFDVEFHAGPAAGQAQELQQLWSEVLGVPNVALDQSFYDLGGDSLSALTVIMKMESMGLDPEVARGIFDGKTIAQIVGLPEDQNGVDGSDAAIAPDLKEAAQVPEQATALQALWGEVLGVQNVALDQSFYDLGGDSLSALTVIMKMESMGLDPEVARRIFDGKTIAEITGIAATTTAAPTDPRAASVATTPVSGQTAALQKLWSEVLGVENIALDQSFHDLGGDSLSALTVIMKMESIGLDPEVARGIFDGKTISDLVGNDAEPASEPVTARPAEDQADSPAKGMRLTLAEAMNSVHATRGILILWVVAVHWLPGFLGAITSHAEAIYQAMNPILRFGTPGFAIVFGLGIGALGLTQYKRNTALFLKGTRFNTMLIVGGVLVLALIRFLREWTGGGLGDEHLLSELFYSAITFYALAMLTMPIVMWLLSQGPNRLLTIFSVLVGSLLIHEVLAASVAPLKPGGILELGKILLTAKYGYFRMMVYVMAGVAIGYMFRAHHDRPGIVRDLSISGLALFVFGFLLVYEIQPDAMLEGFGQVQPWHLMVYAGVALLILAGFSALNRDGQTRTSKVFRWFNALAIASGILALPIFVGHEMVLPTRTFLVNLGLPGSIALLVPLGLFVGGLALAYARLMKFLVR